MRAAAMATPPEANQAKETELDLDAVDGTATVPVPSLIYGARAFGVRRATRTPS